MEDKNLYMCILLFGQGQTFDFDKDDPDLHQTMTYRWCDLFGMRKYVSREDINHFLTFGKTNTFHTLYVNIH